MRKKTRNRNVIERSGILSQMVAFRIHPDQKDMIDTIKDKRGISRSRLIGEIVESFLKDYKK